MNHSNSEKQSFVKLLNCLVFYVRQSLHPSMHTDSAISSFTRFPPFPLISPDARSLFFLECETTSIMLPKQSVASTESLDSERKHLSLIISHLFCGSSYFVV